MNTRQLQLRKTINEVVLDFIKSGKMPLISNVFRETLKRINNHLVGSPKTVPSLIRYREPTDPTKYNEIFTNTVDDISLLYDMVKDQLYRVVESIDYQMTWRSRMKAKIKKLNADIEAVDTMPPYAYTEHFATMENIDLDNSTAYINVLEDKVTFHENIHNSSRIYPNISNVSYTSAYKLFGSIENIFDDSLNSFWLGKYTGDKNGITTLINITFNEPVIINKILLIGCSPSPMDTTITVETEDGTETFNSQQCDSYKNASWYFENKNINSISISFEKDTYDYQEDNNYIYMFGLQSIEFYNNSYRREYEESDDIKEYASIQSDKITFNDIADNEQPIYNVTIEAEDNVPHNCLSKYYISVNNDDEPDNWTELQLNEKVDIVTLQDYESTISSVNSYDVNSNNASLIYSLDSVNVTTDAIDVALRKTSNWSAQYYFYNFEDDDINQYIDGSPTVNDFIALRGEDPVLNITWWNFGNAKSLPSIQGSPKLMVMMTTYFKSEEPFVAESAALSSWWGESQQRLVYLNDTPVYNKKSGYNIIYRFNCIEGWNKLQIVTNDYMPSDITEFENALPSAITSLDCVCDKYPMIRVSPYDLFYKTRQGDSTRYAVDASGNVLVNHNAPVTYRLTYKYIPTINKKYNMFYKAIISREEQANNVLTPQIERIKLIVND